MKCALGRSIWAVLVLTLWAGGSGCGADERAPGNPKSATTVVTNYPARGVVTEIRSNQNEIVVRHDTIGGYMPAMIMPFPVKSTNELAGIHPGDIIAFRLNVTGQNAWIDQVKKTPPAEASSENVPSLPTNGSFRLVRDVEPLAVGERMPDYTFTNQLGRQVRLSDFRGQAVAFTFIYTRCPLPLFCPRLSSNFGEAAKKMASGPGNWHLLTITFDPVHDTPAALQRYAARFAADLTHWDFVTGAIIDIDAITEQFGLYFSRQAGTPNWDHNMRTVVLAPDQKIRHIFVGNSWTADDLVRELRQAMRLSAAVKTTAAPAQPRNP